MLEGLMSNKKKMIQTRNEYIISLKWYNKLVKQYFESMMAELLEVRIWPCLCKMHQHAIEETNCAVVWL